MSCEKSDRRKAVRVILVGVTERMQRQTGMERSGQIPETDRSDGEHTEDS